MTENINTGAPPNLVCPAVTSTEAGTVVVELSPHHAGVLAKILAHYDTLTSRGGLESRLAELQAAIADPGMPLPKADGYTPVPWHHTFIRLLSEKTKAESLPDAVLVPFRPSDGSGR